MKLFSSEKMHGDKIEPVIALKVFDIIVRQGEKQKEGYYFNGLTAISSFDGYTVCIKNEYVSLNLYFHNKFSLETSHKRHKLDFINKINEIYRTHKRMQSG